MNVSVPKDKELVNGASSSSDAREQMFGPNTPVGSILAQVPNQDPSAPFSTRLSFALNFFQTRLRFREARQRTSPPSNGSVDPQAAFLYYTIAVLAEIQFRETSTLDDLNLVINSSIEGLKCLPGQHLKRVTWLPLLVYALEKRAEAFGKTEDIDEGVDYGHQALACTPEDMPVPGLLKDLSSLYLRRYDASDQLTDLETAIGFGEKAVSSAPGNFPRLAELTGSLGALYLRRSHRLATPQDLDKSGTLLEHALNLRPDYPLKHLWLASLGNCYRSLYRHFGRSEDIEKALIYYHNAVSIASNLQHPSLPRLLSELGVSYQILFSRTHATEHLENSVKYCEKAVELTSEEDPFRPGLHFSLGQAYGNRFDSFGKQEDFDREKLHYDKAAPLAADGNPNRSKWLYSIGGWHYTQFWRTNDRESLDISIKYLEQAWSLHPTNSAEHQFSLGCAYRARGEKDDVEKAINMLKHAAHDPTGTSVFRLSSARTWAAACPNGSDAEFEAYSYAVTVLLPLTIWIGVSNDRRYESLIFDVKDLVAKSVAAAISMGRYEAAVEWLEQGHSIVWSQTTQLRAPLDDLYAVNPQMASELKQISHDLELASSKKSAPGPDGRLIERTSLHDAQWHRSLAKRREELVHSVRQLPGFEDFLRPVTASKINSSISDGAVVMLSLYQDQCDALILSAGAENITHVRLEKFSQSKAEIAWKQLVQSTHAQGTRRGFKSTTARPTDSFKEILGGLWRNIVKPVIEQMNITSIPVSKQLPHITWCTSGILSFLPLHAAGDYQNIGTSDYRRSETILANLAISSYVPTIGLLNQKAPSHPAFSGVLAVGHGSAIRDLNRKLDPLPSTKDELDQIERQVTSWPFTRLDDSEASIDRVLEAMHAHSWVHFACHGSQERMSPMESALHLHDKDLTLETIAKHPLKNAQLAFLSACQTATGNSVLPDEGLHLSAGLLMAR